MSTLGNFIKAWRHENGKTMLDLSTLTGIDQALISKYESDKRLPSEKHIDAMAEVIKTAKPSLKQLYLASKIVSLLQYEENPEMVFEIAETRMEYLLSEADVISNIPVLSEGLQAKLEELEILHKQWNSVKPLSSVQLKKMQEYFNLQYTYNSNQIEGNTLTLQETHLVVNEGITINGKSMNEHLEAVNHAEAIDWVYELLNEKNVVNRQNLLSLHKLILKSINSTNAGCYRSVPVAITGSEHKPPQPYLLDSLMSQYFKRLAYLDGKIHPVILAAEAHERLVSIHPFIDGNGRTARLIMNLILLKNGYTLAILKGDLNSRKRYYQALEYAQMNNDQASFYELIIDNVQSSLKAHLALT